MASNITGNVCDFFGGHNDLKSEKASLLTQMKDTMRQSEIILQENSRLKQNLIDIDRDKADLLTEMDTVKLQLETAYTDMREAAAQKDACYTELARYQADESEEATQLNNEYPQVPIYYDYKRYILDEYSKKAYIRYDVREFVSSRSCLLKDAISVIYKSFNPTNERELVEACWSYIMAGPPSLNARYRADDYFGTIWNDFWQFPSETMVLHKGDCEDLSILWASLCRTAGVPAHRIRIMLGLYSGGGHAWGEYYDPESKKWLLVEATMSHRFGTGMGSRTSIYDAYFAFNDKHAWKIKDGVTFGELIER